MVRDIHTTSIIYFVYTSHKYIYNIYSKTSLNRLTMGPTLNGPFREVVTLGSLKIITIVLYV